MGRAAPVRSRASGGTRRQCRRRKRLPQGEERARSRARPPGVDGAGPTHRADGTIHVLTRVRLKPTSFTPDEVASRATERCSVLGELTQCDSKWSVKNIQSGHGMGLPDTYTHVASNFFLCGTCADRKMRVPPDHSRVARDPCEGADQGQLRDFPRRLPQKGLSPCVPGVPMVSRSR